MSAQKHTKKFLAGFTLVEMLVYVFILSLIGALMVTLFLWVVRTQIRSAAAKEVIEGTRAALVIMENEIKEAQGVYDPTTSTSPPQLSLETVNNPPSGEDSTYVDFFLCGTKLCVKKESQNPLALTPENVLIQNLSFEQTQTGPSIAVQIIFDAVYNNTTNRPELDFSMHVQTTISQR